MNIFNFSLSFLFPSNFPPVPMTSLLRQQYFSSHAMRMARHNSTKSKMKPENCWKHYLERVLGKKSSIYNTARLMEMDPMLKFLENSSWGIGSPKNWTPCKLLFIFIWLPCISFESRRFSGHRRFNNLKMSDQKIQLFLFLLGDEHKFAFVAIFCKYKWVFYSLKHVLEMDVFILTEESDKFIHVLF